jgi:hypothetical protein
MHLQFFDTAKPCRRLQPRLVEDKQASIRSIRPVLSRATLPTDCSLDWRERASDVGATTMLLGLLAMRMADGEASKVATAGASMPSASTGTRASAACCGKSDCFDQAEQ